MRLKGKRVAILAEDTYQEMELWYPYYRLLEEGAQVQVVGNKKQHASKHGYPVQSDLSAEEAEPEDFDALVIPGGYAPDLMRRSAPMVRLTQAMFEQGKLVAAICHAGWMLCSAGVVKGRTATCFFSIKDDLKNAGANYVDQEVAVDGNLITSRHPGDLPAFLRATVEWLEGKK
ncbi:MAG: type 1 glutamine amidotransferase domain-containing protein [Nitrospinota bacterium]